MVIKQVMLMAWDMWADRNNINQTSAEHLTKHKEALDDKIREEFEKRKEGLEQEEHHRLGTPIQTTLEQYSEHRKQLWLDSVCRARNIPKLAPPPPTSLDIWLRASDATAPSPWKQKYRLKLLQNLYGLKDAGATWFNHLTKELTNMGFQQGLVDPCLFFRDGIVLERI